MPRKGRSRFNVDTTAKGKKNRTYQGRVFDSLLELKFYQECIEPALATGEIVSVDFQKAFVLQEGFTKNGKKFLPIKYVCDFYITLKDGRVRIIDVKGQVLPEFLLKQKMFEYRYPDFTLEVIGRSLIDGGFMPIEEIKKARKERKKAKK